MTESTAIALHLCELAPDVGLAPATGAPDRGAFLGALCWADNEFGSNLYMRRGGMTDPRTVGNLGMAQRRLLEALARGPYMLGERFSAVDVMIGFAVLFLREHLPADGSIDAYAARLRARPAVARALLAKDAFPAVAA